MFEVLTGSSFLEKAFLLILGAVLTGILVPLIKLRMDRNWFREQKIFEADVARQGEIVRARAQFLKDLVDPVWQFQLLALQVSYDTLMKKQSTEALRIYDEQSWQHLKKIRTIIGGARWFTSAYAYNLLMDFVDGWLLRDVDMQLMSLRNQGKEANWAPFHQWLYDESRKRTDALLVALAQDFNLAPSPGASDVPAGISAEQDTHDARGVMEVPHNKRLKGRAQKNRSSL